MIKPRGAAVSLFKGSLPEVISPYMQRLIAATGGEHGPIGLQFVADRTTEQATFTNTAADPQDEHRYEVAPGLIYKYRGICAADGGVEQYGRVLWTISRFCATYCRFCFRGRMVGMPVDKQHSSTETLAAQAYLTDEQLEETFAYIESHPEINEVILSGGDPLIAPQPYLRKILSRLAALQKAGSLDFIRIHTRAPITNPLVVQPYLYSELKNILRPHIVLHINHPAELTPEVRAVVTEFLAAGAMLFSQTVLLKGVNDSKPVLLELFTECARLGIRPYYMHFTDPVPWAARFTVPFAEARTLWQSLRPALSGIVATVRFVVDTPHGVGKVAVPDSLWNEELTNFRDFTGSEQHI